MSDADGRPDTLRLLREEVSNLVRSIPGPVAGVSLRMADCSLEVTWPQGVAAVAAPVAAPPPPDVPVAETGVEEVVAPLVGTFYTAPEPGASPFVQPGAHVEVGDTVGIVEAMKLMNPVAAQVRGEVVEILVGNAEAVEFEQPLVRIRAAS